MGSGTISKRMCSYFNPHGKSVILGSNDHFHSSHVDKSFSKRIRGYLELRQIRSQK